MTSLIIDVRDHIPSSREHRSASTQPDKPHPTISKSYFLYLSGPRSPDNVSLSNSRGASDVSPAWKSSSTPSLSLTLFILRQGSAALWGQGPLPSSGGR